MYRAVIIEDESRLREALFLMLQKAAPDKVNIIGFSDNVEDALEVIETMKPNLVFMDIQLKGGTGFEILERLNYKNFHLIFTTAYEEHAIKAFKYNALDYLLKPIDALDLKTAIVRIETLQNSFLQDVQIEGLTDHLASKQERVILPTQEAIHVVKLTDIIRCETSGSYTTFHVVDGRKIMVSKSLKDYDDLLTPPNFVRVHQSHTVNLSFVLNYSKEGYLQLKDKTTIPISQRKKEEFLKWLK